MPFYFGNELVAANKTFQEGFAKLSSISSCEDNAPAKHLFNSKIYNGYQDR